jgi:hypothetical protein
VEGRHDLHDAGAGTGSRGIDDTDNDEVKP